MVRLVLVWLVSSVLLFGFYYFVDRVQKQATAKWTSRFAWCGFAMALVLSVIIFLERL